MKPLLLLVFASVLVFGVAVVSTVASLMVVNP